MGAELVEPVRREHPTALERWNEVGVAETPLRGGREERVYWFLRMD